MGALTSLSYLVFAALLLSRGAKASHHSQHHADTVLRNGSIYSLDEPSSKHQAMAIKNGYITFLGNDHCITPFIGDKTNVFDLEGRMVMPGLVDAHMHLVSGGAGLLKCSLNYQPVGLEEILDHIQGCLESSTETPETDWMEVIAVDFYHLTDVTGGVTKVDLDSLDTGRPIIVTSADRHIHWVNTAALEVSGVTSDTPNPPGGVVERLPGGREPSGILQDDARGLLSGPAPATDEDNVASAKAALKLLREQGVTTFQDAASNEDIAKALETVRNDDALSARGYFDYRIDAPDSVDGIQTLIDEVSSRLSTWNDPTELGAAPTLKWQAVKLYVDGIILYPANTGAMIEPYLLPMNGSSEWQPDPDDLLAPYWTPEILTATMEKLILNHIDAQIHVDGDMAVRVALDALEDFR